MATCIDNLTTNSEVFRLAEKTAGRFVVHMLPSLWCAYRHKKEPNISIYFFRPSLNG